MMEVRQSIVGGSASPKTMSKAIAQAQMSDGEAAYFANALRTTRSTLAILRDDSAFVSLAENRSPRK